MSQSTENDAAYDDDDEWCCRPCHMFARALSPLAPGEVEPRVKYLDECVIPPDVGNADA